MAETEHENPPGFSTSEKYTIYSAYKNLFGTIYGIQKRDFALRTLEIPQDDRWAVCAGDKRSQGKLLLVLMNIWYTIPDWYP